MALQKGIRIHQYLDDWLFQAGSLQLVYILVTRPERGQLDLKEGKVRPTLDQWLDFHFPSLLHPVDSVRNLGVWFDADFSFSEHIKRTCKACFLHMRDLRRIRKYLTAEVAILAANALVSSRLDYCNSLFRGLSGFNQYKLQSIQNTLARIVTNHRKYAHVTPILQKLHWLPVRYHCIFKTATLVYKFLHSGSPSYFEPFLSFSSCPYSTRHSHPDRQFLTVPPFHSSVFKLAKHFGHSFAFDAPKIWNDRPKRWRGIPSWNLSLVLYQLTKAPFELIKEASLNHLKHLTFNIIYIISSVKLKLCINKYLYLCLFSVHRYMEQLERLEHLFRHLWTWLPREDAHLYGQRSTL